MLPSIKVIPHRHDLTPNVVVVDGIRYSITTSPTCNE